MTSRGRAQTLLVWGRERQQSRQPSSSNFISYPPRLHSPVTASHLSYPVQLHFLLQFSPKKPFWQPLKEQNGNQKKGEKFSYERLDMYTEGFNNNVTYRSILI